MRPVAFGHVAHALALGQPDRHPALHRRQAQDPGHQVGVDPMPPPRLDDQYQRGGMPRSVVRLRNSDGFDVHHQRR